VKPAYNQQHKWRTACKHCFMTRNTISLVARLTWKQAFWVKIHLYTYKTTYSKMFTHYIHAFLLIYCITSCESSGCFFGPPGIINLKYNNSVQHVLQSRPSNWWTIRNNIWLHAAITTGKFLTQYNKWATTHIAHMLCTCSMCFVLTFEVGLYRIADFTIRPNKNNSFYYSAKYE